MTTVQQLLDEKGGDVWTVGPDATVYDAISLMADHDVGAVVVVDDSSPVGLFTERLYARNVFLKGRASPTTKVRDVMETRFVYAQTHQTVEECMGVMTARKVRHLPVMDDGSMLGIISIGDLVRSKIEDQQFQIEQLEEYIHRA